MIGIYSVGVSVSDYISIVPDTLKGVLTSKLSKGRDEREVAKVCRISFFIGLLISISFVIAGRFMIRIIYGDTYADSYIIMAICSFGSLFICFFKLIASYNLVNNKQLLSLKMLSISVIINIILNIVLIPYLKLIGAALASGVGYTITGILFAVKFSRDSQIPIKELFIIQSKDFEDVIQRNI